VLKAGLRKTRQLGSGQIARASAASLFIKVTGLGFSFFQAVLTARLLGAQGYGVVAVTVSTVQVLATLCAFGFGPLAVREIPVRMAAGEGDRLYGFICHALIAVLALSVAGGAALAVVAGMTELVRPAYRATFEIAGLLVAPLAVIALLRGIAQGFGRIPMAQIPGELLQPLTIVIALGAVALLGLSFAPTDFVWLATGAAMLAAIAGAIWLLRSERSNILLPQRSLGASASFGVAFPFVALVLAGMLQGEMNTLLLGWLGSSQQAGIFQPVVRFSSVITLPGQAAGMRFAPSIAEHWKRGETDRIRWVTRTFTWTTSLLTLAVALAIAAAGPWLMRLFGSDFVQSAPLLWVVAAAQVFNAACGPVGYLLTMSDRSGWALAGQAAGLAANAIFAIVLIPSYGAWGAVLGMGAGIAVWNMAMLTMVKVRHGFDPSLLGSLLPARHGTS
jgi:O-antigen/teichoic acid export membrane protein